MPTKLEIINAMLASIGEEPASSASSQHPSVISALEVLRVVDRRIQMRKWWYNTNYNLPLAKNLAGEVVLPSNTLTCDPVDTQSKLTARGSRLYDPVNNTFNIGADVIVTIVVQLPIEDLPAHAFDYLSAHAVYDFYVNEDGDESKVGRYERAMVRAEMELKSEHLRQLDLNVNDRPAVYALTSRMRGAGGGRNPGGLLWRQ